VWVCGGPAISQAIQTLLSPIGLAILLAFLVPGYIIGAIRAQFRTGRRAAGTRAAVFEAIALSCVNLAIFFPLLRYIEPSGGETWRTHLIWFVIAIAGPCVIGFAIGAATSYALFERLARKLRLTPRRATPKGWDRTLSRGSSTGEWVFVTLKDGTRLAGRCGDRSLMSANPVEADLYIEHVFDVGENAEPWRTRGTGQYIAAGQIRTIEFWPTLRKMKDEKTKGIAARR
jgi:hypothetical protein